MNPYLTIIIPVYNSEKYLSSCFESIFSQNISLSSFEVIVCNDGSTDLSPIICEYWKFTRNNIRVFHSDNRGVSAARNLGINEAKGEIVMFLDSDDILLPYSIENSIYEYKKNKVDILLFDGVRDYGNGKQAILPLLNGEEFCFFDGNNLANLVRRYVDSPNQTTQLQVVWGKIFNTNFLKSNNILFNEVCGAWEDLDFMFDALINAKAIAYKKIPICCSYRRVRNCISNSNCIFFYKRLLYVYMEIYTKLHQHGYPDAEKLFWEGYTTFSVTTLYKLHQYISKHSISKILLSAKDLLNNRELLEHIDYYNPEKNGNWKIFKWSLRHNHPWITLFLFWLQSKYYKYIKK